MTREEQIISEAKKHYSDSINCHNAFLHGVEWADEHPDLSSLWHSADEEPNDGTHILMESNYLDSKTFKCYNIDYVGVVKWGVLKNYFRVSRWAYIDDILPKTKEL